VRLTDDYFIKRLENRKPTVILARPGRDWSASNIEEVTARVDAKDDYALESVEMRYSVNGGAWQSVPLPFTGRAAVTDHVFFLERMGTEAGTALPGDAATALVPGDLISYYVLATDRDETTRTDMFFIEVQPFDRRYTQSQMLGGGGGGQGQWQQEISQRQREIIVSTWNLLREQTESRAPDDAGIEDNATLLSELQTTLAEQAETLARRTRARQLIRVDERIASFVDNLEQAAEAMVPAAERLAAIDLERAIQPEQEALQHLLRAEAAFSDVRRSSRSRKRCNTCCGPRPRLAMCRCRSSAIPAAAVFVPVATWRKCSNSRWTWKRINTRPGTRHRWTRRHRNSMTPCASSTSWRAVSNNWRTI
jgi:hypothetical protein